MKSLPFIKNKPVEEIRIATFVTKLLEYVCEVIDSKEVIAVNKN